MTAAVLLHGSREISRKIEEVGAGHVALLVQGAPEVGVGQREAAVRDDDVLGA